MLRFDLNQLPIMGTIISVAELAARTGYSTRSIQRWKTHGMPLHAADAPHHPPRAASRNRVDRLVARR